ncbi:aminotransferase class I/II-fold pyridoxal phosphate-dependent enzyme [Geobacillus sp. C56-T2]|uniref:aminotransferase class I/II-fold pyridoxal phosphate-dependent enzyme n=1 Tax=Geobacillus sp. C56-T2 TaxID=600773 RepID=UPI00119F4030|nr:aminotransferase class I/II-fold pyridoxal phosphate-dependent enzyme [Geobacillus sp. C56-T2]NNV06514.1 aminotransferase class I/II-fold pyridoxal phosphate-dependent enzyme [Geobacillus sp. MMMUD3]TWG29369.1 LL-diaminopimelate aminotransferase [Geobacillus sp. C56-T2]
MTLFSDLVETMPPYLFSRFQRKKEELVKQGVDVIDLGIGAPDLPPPSFVIEVLKKELEVPEHYTYSPYGGCKEYREAVARFYEREYGVVLDPETEVLALIGSKEGIVHLLQAVLKPGELVLVPDPGYPVYRTAVHFARGRSRALPLDAQNGYAPQFAALSPDVYDEAKLMLLNYPSNPTAAVAEIGVFSEAVSLAHRHRLFIAHDAAYSLVTFAGFQSPSILQVDGAKEVAVEFGSLSKSYNMAGCRIGYVVGNRHLIRALSVIKSNIDTCQFIPIQKAAAAALTNGQAFAKANSLVYEARMNRMVEGLRELGLNVQRPKATFFLWVPVPTGYSSESFATQLLDDAGIIVTPGTAFGPAGEGYIRVSLSAPIERLEQALERWKRVNGEALAP